MFRHHCRAARFAVFLFPSLAGAGLLRAQQHTMMTTPLGIPMDRMGSGTTWIPDGAPLASFHTRLGGWDFTGHGIVFLQYIHQGGTRGDHQFGSLNWGMLMASRNLAGGMLQFRTMLSLDPGTVTRRGYPQLLQTGETLDGQPLHDRQHPHDFWMELGALYLRPVSDRLALQLYVAPSGEPALGPVAFMHRPSAMDDPFAPLSHHWQDATHISFGVVTAGVFGPGWKLEGSVFNGREPDEARWDFDFDPLDSYSARLTLNPASRWSLTAGVGHLKQDDETLDRVAGSILHGDRLGERGQWASTLVYAANIEHGEWSHSVLAETQASLDPRNTLFARAEFMQKSAEELVVPVSGRFNLGTVSLGYIREVVETRGMTLGLGVRGSLGIIPGALEPYYGTRYPTGAAIFLRLRAAQSQRDPMEGMVHDR